MGLHTGLVVAGNIGVPGVRRIQGVLALAKKHGVAVVEDGKISELGSHDELMARVHEYETRFTGDEIPRPPYWSGFRLDPHRIEFWQGRPSRLHERERFDRDAGDAGRWTVQNLYP